MLLPMSNPAAAIAFPGGEHTPLRFDDHEVVDEESKYLLHKRRSPHPSLASSCHLLRWRRLIVRAAFAAVGRL